MCRSGSFTSSFSCAVQLTNKGRLIPLNPDPKFQREGLRESFHGPSGLWCLHPRSVNYRQEPGELMSKVINNITNIYKRNRYHLLVSRNVLNAFIYYHI